MTALLPAPDEALVAHALRLLATAEVAEAPAAARAGDRLKTWRERSASHRAAFAEAQRRWQALAGAAAGLRAQLADPTAASRTAPLPMPTPQRRRLLGLALAGVGVAGLAGANAWWSWQASQPLFAQAWRTDKGQLLRLTLPDAPAQRAPTEIVLSAQTALRAVIYRDRREVELSSGEARFDVAADATRPFIVKTRNGRVEVVGTAFTVADRGGVLTVAVERGRVRFHPQASVAAPPIELRAGNVISMHGNQAPGPLQHMDIADVGAWRSGWLVFDNLPLAQALPAINAFRRAPLVLADVRTGELRLTARFQATDEQALRAALPRVLPVRLEPQTDGSLRVSERR